VDQVELEPELEPEPELARQPGLELEPELELVLVRVQERRLELELRGLWEPVGQPVQVQEQVELEQVELWAQVRERRLEQRPVWRWERLEALESLERPVWRWAPRAPECLALH